MYDHDSKSCLHCSSNSIRNPCHLWLINIYNYKSIFYEKAMFYRLPRQWRGNLSSQDILLYLPYCCRLQQCILHRYNMYWCQNQVLLFIVSSAAGNMTTNSSSSTSIIVTSVRACVTVTGTITFQHIVLNHILITVW